MVKAIDKASKDLSTTGICGPLVFSYKENYPFVTLDSTTGEIRVETSSKANVGVFTVTIRAGLYKYTKV